MTPPKKKPTLGLLDLLQRPPIARGPPLGSIHLLRLLPALDRRLERDLAYVERRHLERIRVAEKDHHGGAGRERRVEVTSCQSNACAVASASGDASVRGIGASPVAFGVNPDRTQMINAHLHTRATHTHSPWRPQCPQCPSTTQTSIRTWGSLKSGPVAPPDRSHTRWRSFPWCRE